MANALWTHKGSKFVIGTLHGERIEITAQYNPKELARQSSAAWNVHPNTSAKRSKTSETHLWMEFGSTEPRTLTLELLFDGYEEGQSIAGYVEQLEKLTMPVDMSSKLASERRPQLCVAVWGNQSMRCVVMSVATKLTMFDAMGEPLRASCTVTLKEVDVVTMLRAERENFDIDGAQRGYAADSNSSRQIPYPPEDSKPTRVPPPNRSATSSPAAAKPAPAPSPAAKPAPAPAPANTVGTPSAKINPAALDDNSSAPLFENEAPAPAPAPNTVGRPSAKINPAALDDNSSAPLFENEAPAPAPAPNTVGTPSAQVDPNAMDGEGDHVFKDEQPAADATSGADSGTADPKYKAAAEDME